MSSNQFTALIPEEQKLIYWGLFSLRFSFRLVFRVSVFLVFGFVFIEVDFS